MSKLYVVGIGPGDLKHMTFAAREAIEAAGVVVGYKTYLDFITPLLAGKEVVSSGMTREVERCGEALRIAEVYEENLNNPLAAALESRSQDRRRGAAFLRHAARLSRSATGRPSRP